MEYYIKEIRDKVGHMPLIMCCSACIIYKDGKVLLEKRADNGKFAICGGFMEKGETPFETLKRELNEELGIIPTNYELMGVLSGKDLHFIYKNGDEVYIVETLFLVTDYEKISDNTDGEVLETIWVNPDKISDNIYELDKPAISMFKEYLKFHKAFTN